MLLEENVITIGAGARLEDAAARMRAYGVQRLGVWSRGELAYELTAADVHRAVRAGQPIEDVRVGALARPRERRSA